MGSDGDHAAHPSNIPGRLRDPPRLNEDYDSSCSRTSPGQSTELTNGTGTTMDAANMQAWEEAGVTPQLPPRFNHWFHLVRNGNVGQEILLTATGPGLTNGGLSGLFWSLCWSYIGMFFVILSLAEMSSMAPTAGGQYHWVSEFAPSKWQKLLSYYTGWLSTIAWQSIVTTDCFLVAGVVREVVQVNYPDYVFLQWHETALTILAVCIVASFNILAAGRLSMAEGIFATCHVFFFVPIVLALWIFSPDTPASDVFLRFKDNGGGWPSTNLSVLVGQLPCMFLTLGSDSVAHLAEEVEDAAVVVPQAMVWSYVLNMPLSFLLMVTFLLNIVDDIPGIMESAYPFVPVFKATFQSRQATDAFAIIILVLLIIITISALASTSRQFFAFSRDNGLPYSKYWKTVSPRFGVPVNAIIFTTVYTSVVALIYIGSTVAFIAILSLSTVALMATYIISIGCILAKRLRGEKLPQAPWTLGRSATLINCVGLVYSLWCFFWSFWPSIYRVAPDNFNWSIVLFCSLMGFSTLLFIMDRDRYQGPAVTVIGYSSDQTT